MSKDYLLVSHSSIGGASSCWRKFELNKLYPRPADSRKSFPGDVGNALHRGYQEYLISRDPDKSLWAMMKAYPYSQEYLEPKDDRSLEAATSTLIEMMQSDELSDFELAYINRPATEEERKLGITKVEVPAIEVPFSLELVGITLPDGRGVKYTGYVDAFMRSKHTGKFRSVDIKTHRRTLKDATASYLYSGQQIGYGIVLEAVMGLPVTEFDVLYYDCFVDLVNPYAKSYVFTKYKQDIDNWLTNLVISVQQIDAYMRMGHFPQSMNGCLNYNKPCFYLPMCHMEDPEEITDWLLGGVDPKEPEPFFPWIETTIQVG